MKEKDVRIETLRVAACFMVILIHIRLEPVAGNEILKTTVLVNCFLAASVGIFFLLAGSFLYEGSRTIRGTAYRYLIRILIPTLLLVFATLIFEKWIMGEATLLECIRNSDFPSILRALKNGVLFVSSDYWGLLCGHLWYVAEYGKLILMFPFIVVLTRHASQKVLLYLAGFSVFSSILIDLYRAFPISGFIYAEPFIISSQSLALIGFLLYKNRGKLEERRGISAGLAAAYLAGILWMFWLQIRLFQAEGGGWPNAYYTTWLSGIGMLTAILLTAFMLSLPKGWKIWSWLKRPMGYMGRRSFMIYLIQYAVILKLTTSGLRARFSQMAVSSWGTLCYYLVFGLLAFGISLLIASALHAGWSGGKTLYGRIAPGRTRRGGTEKTKCSSQIK